MSYKTILTHVVEDEGLPARLAATAAVAAMFEAEVIGLGARAPWPFADQRDGGGADFQRLVQDARAEIARSEQVFLEHRALYAYGARWAADVAYPETAVARAASGADLVASARCDIGQDLALYADPAALALETGAPVLVLPASMAPLDGRVVMVAWKNTRESRRAVSAALPLLKRAERVVLVSVAEGSGPADLELEHAQVLHRLARHGVTASSVLEAGTGRPVGDVLLDQAVAAGADLIVSGAFGHSRLREWVLGGVTRGLLAHPSPYLLLCH